MAFIVLVVWLRISRFLCTFFCNPGPTAENVFDMNPTFKVPDSVTFMLCDVKIGSLSVQLEFVILNCCVSDFKDEVTISYHIIYDVCAWRIKINKKVNVYITDYNNFVG